MGMQSDDAVNHVDDRTQRQKVVQNIFMVSVKGIVLVSGVVSKTARELGTRDATTGNLIVPLHYHIPEMGNFPPDTSWKLYRSKGFHQLVNMAI